ncbi:hypothetical protein AB0C93_35195 [Streptomyces sp. NPDC048518]|uniref:hypothetical protein n=1 Tax=Streptomyces sp. NPDC048518 TaxID=3155029 RepID=UPI0033D55FCE
MPDHASEQTETVTSAEPPHTTQPPHPTEPTHTTEPPRAAELIAAHDRALRDFAEALVLLHIDCGAPPRSDLTKGAKAAGRCPLPASSLTEVFQGRRLPKLDFTIELVRQLGGDRPELLDAWRKRWRHVKVAEQRAAPARRTLRALRTLRTRTGAPAADVPAADEPAAAPSLAPSLAPPQDSRGSGEEAPSRKAIASVLANTMVFVTEQAQERADPAVVMAQVGAVLYQWLEERLGISKGITLLPDMPSVALEPGGRRTAMPRSLVDGSGYAVLQFTPAEPVTAPVTVQMTVPATDERPWTPEESQSGCPVCRTLPTAFAESWACDGCGSLCVRSSDGDVLLDAPRGRRPSDVNAYICPVCALLVHPIKMRSADCPRCGTNLVPGALGRY